MFTDFNLYAEVYGKKYLVRAICKSVKEANDFCEQHPDTSVIGEDKTIGIVLVANDKEE